MEDYLGEAGTLSKSGEKFATVAGILQGAYFAAISLGDLNRSLPPSTAWPFYVPMALWAVTLVTAVALWMPTIVRRGQPNKQIKTWRKARWRLWIASAASLILGLLWMTGAIICYLLFVEIPPPEPLTIVITPCP